MRKYLREILLWLFVINLGTVFGAGIYESRVVIPRWQNTPPQTWPNIGLEFWVYVTTVPLTLLTLANLFAAWQEGQGPRRQWWLGASAITVVERSATFSYFIPTMIRLMESEEMPQEEVNATLSKWLRLGYGRNVLTLVGWLAALKALSLPGESSSQAVVRVCVDLLSVVQMKGGESKQSRPTSHALLPFEFSRIHLPRTRVNRAASSLTS